MSLGPPQESAAPPLQRPHKAANGIATAALRLKGFWHRTEKVHFPPGQHQQTHQLPGVIRQVWVATENFIFPLLATVAVHSPVAYEKKDLS